MTSKKIQSQLQELEDQRKLNEQIANSNRARSINVGTAFGGVTELSMRRDDGQSTWSILQPVEVVELIHQLSANIGCNVALKPRQDFASWREWRVTESDRQQLNGWAPFVNDMAPYNQLGANGMDPEILAALNIGGQLNETHGGEGGKSFANIEGLNIPQEISPAIGRPSGGGQPGASCFDLEGFKRSKENAVATKKTVNRRSAKSATKAP